MAYLTSSVNKPILGSMYRPPFFLIGFLLLIFLQIADRILLHSFPEFVLINYGVIFGLLSRPLAVFVVVTLGIILLLSLFSEPRSPSVNFGLMLIGVGAFSNLIERVQFGGVIDYIPFLHLSIFNLADLSITIGALLLIFREQTKEATH